MKKIKILSIILLFIIIGFFFFLFFTEKGYDLRVKLAQTILSTQHRNWAKFTFLSKEELDRLLKDIQEPKYINSFTEKELKKEVIIEEDIWEINKEKRRKELEEERKRISERNKHLIVEVKTIEKRFHDHYFKGQIVTINNPLNVKTVNSQYQNKGEQISSIAKRVEAIVATNASGFHDPGGNGFGGSPLGILIENGVVTNTKNGMDKKDYVAALTKNGTLITGRYTPNELLKYEVVSAAGFKPQIIVNGKKMITSGDGGWGYGPRTAIGQKKDGSIVLIVIDGRQIHSMGASIKDVQDIFIEEGVINAICMDGGSSASMFLVDRLITKPSAVNNMERYIPNAWVVIPKDNQEVSIFRDGEKLQ